ncbi:CDP-diacylglycerol--glycerol-3-phosphate 3-phosphatidyltransferase, mitochondrial-like [Glandiceps talaboti]
MAASCLRLLQGVRQKEAVHRSSLIISRCCHQIKPQPSEMNGGNVNNVFQKFEWMTQLAPVFAVSGRKVTIIKEPSKFYETLRTRARNASKRIVLASLYLGTGDHEQGLVDSIREAALKSNHPLQVKILLEYTRGSRGKENSRTMLVPLLEEFGSQVQVSLYHTPDLRGLLKCLVPARFNETIGLHHMKVYLFDDSFVISGANLNETYFTNRQDRYILLEDCPHLANFFTELVSTVSGFSFQLQKDDTVRMDKDFGIHPFKGDIKKFKEEAGRRVRTFLENYITPSKDMSKCSTTDHSSVEEHNFEQLYKHTGVPINMTQVSPKDNERTMKQHSDNSDLQNIEKEDTLIFPLIQMGPLGITNDAQATRTLLENAENGTHIQLTSGYFNLTESYLDIILNRSKAEYNMLTADPKTNGFYGAKGVAGGIPDAYTYIAKHFYARLCKHNQLHRIRLYEYYRDKWTFHAKGLWYYFPHQVLPSLSLLGSTNFGYRSVKRDLEVQLAIVTVNEELRKQLHEEQKSLYERSTQVSEATFEQAERFVPYWVRIVTRFIWKHL